MYCIFGPDKEALRIEIQPFLFSTNNIHLSVVFEVASESDDVLYLSGKWRTGDRAAKHIGSRKPGFISNFQFFECCSASAGDMGQVSDSFRVSRAL
jgi:hypothetical protein